MYSVQNTAWKEGFSLAANLAMRPNIMYNKVDPPGGISDAGGYRILPCRGGGNNSFHGKVRNSMNVAVCVGSSCHLRGSYHIIELLRQRLEESGLAGKVDLRAAFCLGKCTDGVSIKVDDEIVCGVSADNFDEIFEKYIASRVK